MEGTVEGYRRVSRRGGRDRGNGIGKEEGVMRLGREGRKEWRDIGGCLESCL